MSNKVRLHIKRINYGHIEQSKVDILFSFFGYKAMKIASTYPKSNDTRRVLKEIGSNTISFEKVKEIDPLFTLGDETHFLVLNLALKNPEFLKNVKCAGLQKISEFLVSRRYKQPYCQRLE